MSRALVLLVVLLSAVAGCVQQPDPAPVATAEAPVAPADVFHPSVASGGAELVEPTPGEDVHVDTPGPAEPNIAVAPDGTLYIANPLQIWRSEDGGDSWTAAASEGLQGGGDGDIAIDANGTLYWLGLFGDAGPIPFQYSTDGGESWSEAIDVSAGSGSDREWIDVTPSGEIYTTWRGSTGLEFNASFDGGKTWLPEVVTLAPDGIQGPIAHDPVTGTLVVPATDFNDIAGVTKPVSHVYVSSDKGATWAGYDTWTLPRDSPVEHNGYTTDFPAIAFDGAGTLYLVYSADISGMSGGIAPPEALAVYGTYLQVSHDLGQTWTDPLLLSAPDKDARFPWIAAGAPGRIAVVWYENENGIPGEMLPDVWNVILYESITADQDAIEGVVVQLTSEPNHIGQLCTSGTGCAVSDRSLLDFFEVAIDLQGQPVIAFASSDLGVGFTGLAVRTTEVHFVTVEGTSLL